MKGIEFARFEYRVDKFDVVWARAIITIESQPYPIVWIKPPFLP